MMSGGLTITRAMSSRNFWRVVVLVLLVVAILGPWSYTSDGLPPPEWCFHPNILLESNRCVRLVTGIEIFSFLSLALIGIPVALASGATSLAQMAREFLFVIFMLLLVLPMFGTLIVILRGETWRLRMLNMVVWVLAVIPALWIALHEPMLRPWQVWGIWLYIGLPAGMLGMEFLARNALTPFQS